MAGACAALTVPRATCYRGPGPARPKRRPRAHPRALSERGKTAVLATLHEGRFQDCAPPQVFAALLDEGRHQCSTRTLYRILAAQGENRERRGQLVHPSYQRPDLLATGPSQLWSWDITRLRGAAKRTFYSLCVILGVLSRYVAGRMVARRESSALAQRLIEHSRNGQQIPPRQLTIHADRGSWMKSMPVALLLADPGIVKTHSRPHVSKDSRFSESQSRTLKYRPGFPDRFGSITHARLFCQPFFLWYYQNHHHPGLGLLTPAAVHYGHAPRLLAQRQLVPDGALGAHPERFVRRAPRPRTCPRRPGSTASGTPGTSCSLK